MAPVTTIDSIAVDLPDGADETAGTPAGTDVHERRWLAPDGLYVALGVGPTDDATGIDLLPLDLRVAEILGRYGAQAGATVHAVLGTDLPGSLDARVARVSLRTGVGEELELLLLSALSLDRQVVTLQVSWPAAAADEAGPAAAFAVAESLRLA